MRCMYFDLPEYKPTEESRLEAESLPTQADTILSSLSSLESPYTNRCIQHPLLAILPLSRLMLVDFSSVAQSSIQDYIFQNLPKSVTGQKGATLLSNGYHYRLVKSRQSLLNHIRSPWCNVKGDESDDDLQEVKLVIQDFDQVISDSEFLRTLINEEVTKNISRQSVGGTKFSISQSTSVQRLTRLAFVFIPLTFATSVFGMNMKEWQTEVPSIIAFVAVAIVVTSLTIIFALVSSVAGICGQSLLYTDEKYTDLLRAARRKSTLLAIFFFVYIIFHSGKHVDLMAIALGLKVRSVLEEGTSEGDFSFADRKGSLMRLWGKAGLRLYARSMKKNRRRFAEAV